MRTRNGQIISSWMRWIAAAILAALLINNFLLVNATVMTGSMEETVMTGSRVFCNRLAYRWEEPRRFDVIIFNFGQQGESSRYFKRVIGLPGETVEIVGGKVYIDGSPTPLPDPFVSEEPYGDYGPFEVPDESYFVMGDNRNHSYDSKGWPDPYVKRGDILGKAFLIYFPQLKGFEDYNEDQWRSM